MTRHRYAVLSLALLPIACTTEAAPSGQDQRCAGVRCDADPITALTEGDSDAPAPPETNDGMQTGDPGPGPLTPEAGVCETGATECLSGSSTRYRECTTAGEWSPALDCGDERACVDGECGGECRPGQTRCVSASTIETCDERGRFGDPERCDNGCANDTCQNECSEGETRCANEREVRVCDSNEQFRPLAECEFACDRTTDRCDGECVPGDVACDGATPIRCDERGRWQRGADCEFVCAAGSCRGECAPGDTTSCGVLENALGVCAARSVTCSGSGLWPRTSCAPTSDEICDASGRDEDCDGDVDEEPPCASGFRVLSAGPNYACAVSTTGAVSCWGNNGFGNLGAGFDGLFRPAPAEVPGVSGAVSVATGLFGTCALLVDGSARCWGSMGNTNGLAVRLIELSDIEALSLGEAQTCALLRDQTVRCTNAGPGPLVGFAAVLDQNGDELDGVDSIDSQGGTFFCALMRDDSARCWGFSGVIPGFAPGVEVNSAQRVDGIAGARQVVTGSGHACALTDAGVACWGENSSGQLGVDPVQLFSSEAPVAVDVGAAVQAIDAGDAFTCALLTNGRVRCWGLLGQETTPAPREIGGLTQATALSVGQDAACVLRSDRTAACFGDNRSGQLGDGSSSGASETEFLPPARVLGP